MLEKYISFPAAAGERRITGNMMGDISEVGTSGKKNGHNSKL